MIRKFWLVASHEYFRHVMRKRFLFGLLSLPFFILMIIGVGLLNTFMQYSGKPAGYIDLSNEFTYLQPIPKELQGQRLFPRIEFVPFDSEEDANASLNLHDIQAYFILDPDYMQSGNIAMVYLGIVGQNVEDDFSATLRYNLLLTQPESIRVRLSEGTNLVIRTPDGKRELAENNFMGILLPIFAALVFVIAVTTSGGYLMQAVVEEKENRTMEIMVTSLSPRTLMAAKIMGNIAIGLTQLFLWIIFGWLCVVIGGKYIPFLHDLSVDPSSLLLLALTFLPAFVLVGALMAMVGAMVTESSEAQQVAGIFTLPIILPFWFSYTILLNPNGPIAVGLSIFPLTAPVTLPLRAAVSNVPAWQIALTISILVLGALGALWLASRAFQLGMLRYGKRLSLKTLFHRKV